MFSVTLYITHMLWSCPKLFSYWQPCFKSVPDIPVLNMNTSPHVTMFDLPPDELRTTTVQNNVLVGEDSPLVEVFSAAFFQSQAARCLVFVKVRNI